MVVFLVTGITGKINEIVNSFPKCHFVFLYYCSEILQKACEHFLKHFVGKDNDWSVLLDLIDTAFQ